MCSFHSHRNRVYQLISVLKIRIWEISGYRVSISDITTIKTARS